MPRTAVLLTLLGALLVAILAAALRPLAEPDEGRYGEAAREMTETGDWLLPRQNGRLYPDKPPGVYWAMALSLEILGTRAFAIRLPALLAYALLLLLLLRPPSWAASAPASVRPLAAVFLATCPLSLVLAELATLDSVLSLTVAAAVLAGWRLLAEDRPASARACGAALGLSFLVKGPVGPVLSLAILAVAGARARLPLRRLLRPGLLLPALLLGLPWYLLAALQRPQLLDFWILRETVGRVASDVHARAQPLWFFPALALGLALPWLPALLLGRRPAPGAGPAEDPGRSAACALGSLPAVWAFLPVLFFSLPASKQPAYLAPAVPGLALWIGLRLARRPAPRAAAAAAAALLALAAAALVWSLEPGRIRSIDPLARTLVEEGARDWEGAQVLDWAYGLSFRLERPDFHAFGAAPRAWSFEEGEKGPPPADPGERSRRAARRRERAFADALDLLEGPQPAFVLLHETGDPGVPAAFEAAASARRAEVHAWGQSGRYHLYANRPRGGR